MKTGTFSKQYPVVHIGAVWSINSCLRKYLEKAEGSAEELWGVMAIPGIQSSLIFPHLLLDILIPIFQLLISLRLWDFGDSFIISLNNGYVELLFVTELDLAVKTVYRVNVILFCFMEVTTNLARDYGCDLTGISLNIYYSTHFLIWENDK